VELSSEDGSRLATATVSGTSWRTPDLAPGRYSWRVTARDAQGHTSSPSAPRHFERIAPVTLAAPVFEAPRDGEALREDAMLDVRWRAVPGAAGYEVVVDERAPSVVELPRLSGAPLAPGWHAFRVRAFAKDGVSPWAGPLHVSWGAPAVAAAELAQVGLELRVTLRDAFGHAIGGSPKLSVARGALTAPVFRDGQWLAQWTPPPDGHDTLVLEERGFRTEWPLARADAPPFVVGLFAGGQFNGGPIASPSAVLSVGYRLPVLQRRPGVDLRGGLYAARAQASVGGLEVAGSGWLVPLSLLVGWRQPVGAYELRGALGPGVQVGFFEVDGQRSTAVSPGLDVVAGVGRRLGPGRLEAEAGFSWAHFDTPALRLIAGGFGVRVGYAFDF
jgi:hypothetical protein